jgi:ribosome maturation factor RimP
MDVRGIELQVAKIAEPIAEGMGLSVLDVEFSYEVSNWYLRLYIEKESGVGIEDCTRLSEAVDAKLEESDPISQAYVLEVTSSGEKPLRFPDEYSKFSGRNVLISTYKPIEGLKKHEGELIGLLDGIVRIKTDEREYGIPLEMVGKARLAFKY